MEKLGAGEILVGSDRLEEELNIPVRPGTLHRVVSRRHRTVLSNIPEIPLVSESSELSESIAKERSQQQQQPQQRLDVPESPVENTTEGPPHSPRSPFQPRNEQENTPRNRDTFAEDSFGTKENSQGGLLSTGSDDTMSVYSQSTYNGNATKEARFSRDDGNRGLFRSMNQRFHQHGQHVQIRNADMMDAMDTNARRRQRFKKRIAKWMGTDDDENDEPEDMKISMHGRFMVQPSQIKLMRSNNKKSDTAGDESEEVEDEDDEEQQRLATQYRLTTIKNRTSKIATYDDTNIWDAGVTCCTSFGGLRCPNGDQIASKFLHWSFRSHFAIVFGTAALGWLAMTSIFAIVYYIIGKTKPNCIGGVEFSASPAPFLDAYQLSWTTFSTVGYGLVYPEHKKERIGACTLITVLAAFESFVGVLFASLCAALMFAKIGRVQSFAQVQFSDPMVIRYGTGITDPVDDDDDDNDDDNNNENGGNYNKGWASGKKAQSDKHIPCPVLEFRIFNRLSSIQGGEIIDATLNMVASIDASQIDPALMLKSSKRRKKGKKRQPAEKSQSTEAPLRNRQAPLYGREAATPISFGSSFDEDSCSGAASVESPMRASAIPQGIDVPLQGPTTPIPIPPSLQRRAVSQPLADNNTQRTRKAHRHSLHPPNAYLAGRLSQSVSTNSQFNYHGARSSGIAGSGIFHNLPSIAHRKRGRRDSRLGALWTSHIAQNQFRMKSVNLQHFEEDPSGKLSSKKVLSKLDVESPDHPFFRRVWLVRHTLDVNSLLLKPHVRQMLRRNRGYWPQELNNYESIRASIQFDQILVSITGTSNADANSVYAQHVYHLVDVNIGYRFVNALYRNPDGALGVDASLINDVMEQAGGGGEPLENFNPDSYHEMYVL